MKEINKLDKISIYMNKNVITLFLIMVCQIHISTLRGRFCGMDGPIVGCGADQLVEIFCN